MRYARHSINRIDTQRARFDLSTRSVPSVTSVKPLQHVFEYTGAKVLRARVVVTYSAWLYRGYTMGVQGMIFLTYVINEPRARSAVQVHMGGGGRVAHPRSILFSAQPPRSSAFVRARARARASCERYLLHVARMGVSAVLTIVHQRDKQPSGWHATWGGSIGI